MNKNKESVFVFDTSALLTFIEGEKGYTQVDELLIQAESGEIRILVSFVSFMEIYYISLQEYGAEDANERLDLVKQLACERIESSEELAQRAAVLKASHRISFADSWVAALALENNATIVHKDPEFEQIPDLKQLVLPYKSR